MHRSNFSEILLERTAVSGGSATTLVYTQLRSWLHTLYRPQLTEQGRANNMQRSMMCIVVGDPTLCGKMDFDGFRPGYRQFFGTAATVRTLIGQRVFGIARHAKRHQEPEPPDPQSPNRPPAERRRGVAERVPNQPRTVAYLPLHAALLGLQHGGKISTAV
jgi:hypothetical protein